MRYFTKTGHPHRQMAVNADNLMLHNDWQKPYQSAARMVQKFTAETETG